MTDYLTQREAADLLRVSVSYLRASDCPKVLLPPSRGKKRPVVRYSRADLEAWVSHWRAKDETKPVEAASRLKRAG
jgi:hypothetical protein